MDLVKIFVQIGMELNVMIKEILLVLVSGIYFQKKDQMKKKARALGYDVRDHNEADAVAVWHRAVAYYDKLHKTSYASFHMDPLLQRTMK